MISVTARMSTPARSQSRFGIPVTQARVCPVSLYGSAPNLRASSRALAGAKARQSLLKYAHTSWRRRHCAIRRPHSRVSVAE